MEITPDSTWSYRGAKKILSEKGLEQEIPDVAEAFREFGGGNRRKSERQEVLKPLGWRQEVSIKFTAPQTDGSISRNAAFDAFKNGVAVEHERKEQMRANWHLMKMDAGFRDPRGFSGDKEIEVGVLLTPSDGSPPKCGRTRNDVLSVLSNYFGFSVPLFVWEYPTEDHG